MEVIPFQIEVLRPPKDTLHDKILASALTLEEHDVIAISSKVVSIGEGRCVHRDEVDKDTLIQQMSDSYLPREETPGGHVMHTITRGIVIPNAGIDPFGGYYILWPEDPQQTAEELLSWFKKSYGRKHLSLVLTDSRSVLLRRGVVGIAIAYAGFSPLYDNRATVDLLGVKSGGSQTNIPDSLAASAVYVMGEANEQTPIVRIRNAPYIVSPQVERRNVANTYEFGIEEDIFAPFMKNLHWQKGGNKKEPEHEGSGS